MSKILDDLIQSQYNYNVAFYIHLKEYNNKVAKVRIEQRGANAEGLIFHNLDVPIPDAE